jgi:hypothetical protein
MIMVKKENSHSSQNLLLFHFSCCGLDGWISIHDRTRDFCLLHIIMPALGTYLIACAVGTGGVPSPG